MCKSVLNCENSGYQVDFTSSDYRAAKVLRFVEGYRRTLSKTYHRLLVVLTADFNSPTISKYW